MAPMTTDEKIDKIYKSMNEMKIFMATADLHIKNHATDISTLKVSTEKIEADRNRAYGFLTLGGLLWTGFLTWLFKSNGAH